MNCGKLSEYVKNVCRITWDDSDTESRINAITEDAVVTLHHKLGMPGEPSPGAFENPGMERTLFGNYCLYCWNNIQEEFEANYKRDILMIRHKYEVEAVLNEKELETYNDGFVNVYRKKKENMTANRNITSLSELDYIIRLAYSEMSRRQQDLEFADQNSFSLTIKIKTPKPPTRKDIDASCFVVIGSTLYAVQYIDTNSTEYFFYLEKVRTL